MADFPEKPTPQKEAEITHLASFPQFNPNPVVELDLECNVKYANPAAKTFFPTIQTSGSNHPFFADWEQLQKTLSGVKESSINREIKIGQHWFYQQISLIPSINRVRIYAVSIDVLKNTEKALQKSEQRWETTLSSIGDAVIATDLTGKITFMNKVAEALTGWTLPEAQQIPLKKVFHIINEYTHKEVESPIERVLKEGLVVGLANHTILIQKNKSEVPIDDSGAPIKDKNGKITGVVLVFRDITERKKGEEEVLKAKEQTELDRKRLETILETSPSAVVIIEAQSGKFSYVNKRAAQLYGFDTIGLSLDENVAKVRARRANGTDYPIEEMPVTRSLKLGQEVRNQEMIIERADGQVIPIIASTAPLRDMQGNITAAIVIFEDITENKKFEQALKESEERYRSLFSNMMDGFAFCQMIFDKENKPVDFIYREINDAFEKITGLKRDRVIDKKVTQAIPGIKEANPELFEIYGRVASSCRAERFEIFFKPLSMWLSISVYCPVKGYFAAVFEDITERKRIQSKLEDNACLLEEYANQMEELANDRAKQLNQAERLVTIGQTAGMVGHDIRNPLQAIAGELYLAKDELYSLPDNATKKNVLESITSIEENLYYIDKIVADLQDYTKPLKPTKEKVNIEKIIEETLLIVSIPSNLEVSISVEKGFPSFMCDFSMLKRVIMNLVQNAVQAMPNGGKLKINAEHQGKQVCISVSDTGEGIPEEVQTKLFTPLFTTKSKGQGFGLAVVKRLVEAQDGKITFDSQKGKGTTFIIRLPAT